MMLPIYHISSQKWAQLLKTDSNWILPNAHFGISKSATTAEGISTRWDGIPLWYGLPSTWSTYLVQRTKPFTNVEWSVFLQSAHYLITPLGNSTQWCTAGIHRAIPVLASGKVPCGQHQCALSMDEMKLKVFNKHTGSYSLWLCWSWQSVEVEIKMSNQQPS